MIDPKDVDKVSEEDWEQFKKDAAKDELYYNGPGDLLDTPEGRAKFCRLNKTSVYRKPDPSMVVKKRSHVDPALMEDIEYDASGKEISRSYEPA